MGGWGGVVGEMGNKAISAFNSVEVEVEAELGKSHMLITSWKGSSKQVLITVVIVARW